MVTIDIKDQHLEEPARLGDCIICENNISCIVQVAPLKHQIVSLISWNRKSDHINVYGKTASQVLELFSTNAIYVREHDYDLRFSIKGKPIAYDGVAAQLLDM